MACPYCGSCEFVMEDVPSVTVNHSYGMGYDDLIPCLCESCGKRFVRACTFEVTDTADERWEDLGRYFNEQN